jgi:flagella basal body P-ring formation protein FlgA
MTDLYGRFILTVALIAMLFAAARAAFAGVDVITPREAIAAAVERRVGGDVTVAVNGVTTTVAAERGLHALPEPGGRAGEPMRFVLMAGRVRRGVAVATVTVVGSYARAVRPIARNEAITSDAVEIIRGELPALSLGRLPKTDEVIGLVARRDIAPREALTQAVVQVPPAVRAGDAVDLTVTVGRVRISTKAVAAASGHEGDLVRVVPAGGKALKARITGRGTVESIQ